MKRHWLIASIVALLAIGPVLADPLPINQLPMYGEREKNDAMKNADAAFIASIEKQGLSREEGAKQVSLQPDSRFVLASHETNNRC